MMFLSINVAFLIWVPGLPATLAFLDSLCRIRWFIYSILLQKW